VKLLQWVRRGVSLRFLMVMVAVTALGLGWFAYRVRAQRKGIELIRKYHGMYYHDFEYADSTFPKNPRSRVPEWLLRTLGIDAFHNVSSVQIESPQFNDDDLERLTAYLPRIVVLGIAGTSITDNGLLPLRGNRRLEAIFMPRTRVRDAGVDNLAIETMPVLELLDVRGTNVSPAKVATVKAVLDAREASIRRARPGAKISMHMVLSGFGVPPANLGPDPRGDYEKTVAPGSTKTQADDAPSR
jgi:hypothetical protein